MAYRGEIIMTKRQLDSKYKDLVEYVKDMKDGTDLKGVLDWLNGNFKEFNGLEIVSIIDKLDDSSDEFISTIVDIYNDNYELKESSYYWKFKELRGPGRCDLYFGTTNDDEPLLVDIEQNGFAEKCTKSELNNYLRYTELTADNFTLMEEIENY